MWSSSGRRRREPIAPGSAAPCGRSVATAGRGLLCVIALRPVLEESGRDGDADTDQDDATQNLAPVHRSWYPEDAQVPARPEPW